MSRKTTWKRCVSVLIAFALVVGSMAGIGNQRAEAAARKTIGFVKIMQGGKNVTKKTLKMKAGATKKLAVKVKATKSQVTSSKEKITFHSSDKKVVTVNKNGKLAAKKSGSAKIAVTVSKKGYKTKKTWVRISVEKGDKAPAATAAPDVTETQAPTGTPEADATVAPTITPNVTETQAPTGTPEIDATVAPTITPDVTETQAPTGTPEADATVAPTITPNVTETPNPTGTPDATEIPTAAPDVTVTPIPDSGNDNGKILVAYFSWSGTSERIAQNIINQTGADSFRIERETPYSDDYSTVAYGEAKDEADNNARPPLKNPLASVAAYDKIVLCYPIWWHTAPMTVGTFLESYDLTGKTIYPVSQSASMSISQYNESVAFIRECAKGAIVDDGLFTKDNDAIREYVDNTILK